MLDARLEGLDRDAEMLLEEDDQLQRADRVEDSPGDQRRPLGELAGILAGEEFAQDEVMNDRRDIFHDGLARLLQPARTRCSRHRPDRGGSLPLGDEAELGPVES
jgi:hypothetical protein